MSKVNFKIASNSKLAEFIFDLRYTIDPKKLKNMKGSSCIFIPLSISTKKDLLKAKKFSKKLKEKIICDLNKTKQNNSLLEMYKKDVQKEWKILEKDFF